MERFKDNKSLEDNRSRSKEIVVVTLVFATDPGSVFISRGTLSNNLQNPVMP